MPIKLLTGSSNLVGKAWGGGVTRSALTTVYIEPGRPGFPFRSPYSSGGRGSPHPPASHPGRPLYITSPSVLGPVTCN